MDEVVYGFPNYIEPIINCLLERQWFMHPYDLQNPSDIYNPAEYLYNSEFDGVEYTVFLDLNIYQYVLSAFKKNIKNELHRDAIALIVFGRVANFHFDPTLAIYEKLNYDEQCSEELIDDLILFRKIENSCEVDLAKFALGINDYVPLGMTQSISKEGLKFELTKYNRLKKWDNFYVFILKISELNSHDNLSGEEKISNFIKWCFNDFMYSLVAISLVIILWGRSRVPKLMKFNLGLSKIKKIDVLNNMTWDLFLMDKFFESWKNKNLKQEFIFVSNDTPLKKVLELAISIQKAGDFNHLNEYLSPNLIEEFSKLSCDITNDKNREILKITNFKDYRDKIIQFYEKQILY